MFVGNQLIPQGTSQTPYIFQEMRLLLEWWKFLRIDSLSLIEAWNIPAVLAVNGPWRCSVRVVIKHKP